MWRGFRGYMFHNGRIGKKGKGKEGNDCISVKGLGHWKGLWEWEHWMGINNDFEG